MHLGHIAKMFAAGNFKAPMLIHNQISPGVPTMQKLKNDIQYNFEEDNKAHGFGSLPIVPKPYTQFTIS